MPRAHPAVGLTVLFLLPVVRGEAAGPPRPAPGVDFARDVRPLLAERCVRCHGPKKQEGGLRLDLRRRARA